MLPERKCWKIEVHCSQKDGDQLREYKAVHEERFLSSWRREDVEGTEDGRKNINEEAGEEESKSGKREVEREKETR